MNRITVRAVAFQGEDGRWFAQGIEYDILASATSLIALPRAFERALAANLCVNSELGRDALDGLPPAPLRYGELFDASSQAFSYEEQLNDDHARPMAVERIALRVTEAA